MISTILSSPSTHFFTRLKSIKSYEFIDLSFILAGLVDALLLFLALDFTVLLLVLGLHASDDFLVLLILSLKTVFGGLVDLLPHVTDDLGDFGNLGSRVVGLDSVVDFATVEEES